MPRESVLGSASRLLLLFLAGAGAWATPQENNPQVEPGRDRMSEEALRALLGVAELRVGVTVFRYEKTDNGGYVPSYESSVCPLPGATRRQALAAAGRGDVEREALGLRPLADLDGSGVVSVDEAASLAGLVDFGFRLNAAAKQDGPFGEMVAKLMGLRAQELLGRVREYQALVTRGSRLGIALAAAPALDWKKQ